MVIRTCILSERAYGDVGLGYIENRESAENVVHVERVRGFGYQYTGTKKYRYVGSLNCEAV